MPAQVQVKEEARLRKLCGKADEPLRTILLESLGPSGACCFEFKVMQHVKKQRRDNSGTKIVQDVVKYVCTLCNNSPAVIEDHSSTKRHLLYGNHVTKVKACGRLSTYAQVSEVHEAATKVKASSTSKGRRCNSKQGKAAIGRKNAVHMQNQVRAVMQNHMAGMGSPLPTMATAYASPGTAGPATAAPGMMPAAMLSPQQIGDLMRQNVLLAQQQAAQQAAHAVAAAAAPPAPPQ